MSIESDLALASRKIAASALSDEDKDTLIFRASQNEKVAEAIKLKDPVSEHFLQLFLHNESASPTKRQRGK